MDPIANGRILTVMTTDNNKNQRCRCWPHNADPQCTSDNLCDSLEDRASVLMAVARAARSSLKEIEACDPPLPEGHSPDAVTIQLLDHRIMPKLPDPYGVIPKRRQLASDLVDAVRASNVERFDDAFEALGEDDEALTRAMRGVAKLPRPSTEFQSYCFDLWLRNGNYLRGQINGANVLAAGLRFWCFAAALYGSGAFDLSR